MVKGDVCKIKNEFEKTVALFEKEKVDAIVTLHRTKTSEYCTGEHGVGEIMFLI